MSAVEIVGGYLPGAIGRTAELHALYYAREWGFTPYFECKVAAGLSEFFSRFDPARDGFWSAVGGGKIEGAVAIDGLGANEKGMHLRWFIMSDRLRGQGIGERLLSEALDFARAKRYPSCYLNTFGGLAPARHLYEKHGFRLVEESWGDEWGTRVLEQRFVLGLGPDGSC